MRAEGKQNKEIREKTGFHTQYITVLVSRYKANGLASITESHYHGNHRNLSYAEEEALGAVSSGFKCRKSGIGA